MRIQEKQIKQYPWYLRLFFSSQRKKYGQELTSGLLWGRIPLLFLAVSMLFGFLNRKKSPISPLLRAMICTRISQINGCSSCIDLNSALVAERAGSMEKVDSLSNWKENDIYDEKERVVLEYAEAITLPDQQVSDALFSQLQAFLDDDGIIELTGLIGYQHMSNIFNTTLQIPSQGLCKIELKN